MKLANKALIISLTILAMMLSVSAQTLRPDSDPRNLAPTVGTGGPPGGVTGLFTVIDGQTLRKGEFTFSAAYSNFDRDPGDVDIVEVPVSFQVGVTDYLELFFNTDAYRALKVNSPRNLSSFYLPNSRLMINGVSTSGPAIILGPAGIYNNRTIFRPTGSQPFVNFPYFGGTAANIGGAPTIGGVGPFVLGPSNGGGNGAANFAGIGSPYGSILPGVVLQTANVTSVPGRTVQTPTTFSVAPSYLPDAPFINRTYAESAFNAFTVGAKIRFTSPNNPVGIGVVPFYTFYADRATSQDGFNQLTRGASPGSKRGDFGAILFADVRARKWVNISGNIGYKYNGDVKGTFPGGDDVTILDRGDEILAGIGVDFPVNKYFQPILEFRSTQYVAGRTPNAFENSPIEGLAGTRIFPTRYFGLGFAYRYHFNQQDRDSFDNNDSFRNSVSVIGTTTTTTNNNFTGVPPGLRTSSDPHGFIVQAFIGRRNARQAAIVNLPPNVDNLTLSESTVYLPCAPGTRSTSGGCSDEMMVNATTAATDPENDVLTYEYTVSGGRIVGQGSNVNWDLSGVRPGTYTITAGVNDGCGICGQTKTQTITVADCPDCKVECECPTVSVTGPSGVVQPGDSMTFSANVNGGSTDATYNWSVDQGTITEGQGTPTITVDTTGLVDTTITATVDLGGLCETCPTVSDSETGVIAGRPEATLINTIGNVPNDEVRAQIDSLFIQLQNNPSDTAYILTYGSSRDIGKREKLIKDHIRLRRYDSSRVVFLSNADGSELRSDVYLVPQGVTPPTP